jgi:hypothetical protein
MGDPRKTDMDAKEVQLLLQLMKDYNVTKMSVGTFSAEIPGGSAQAEGDVFDPATFERSVSEMIKKHDDDPLAALEAMDRAGN